MRYDQLRDVVAKRIPGWEHLQEVKPLFYNISLILCEGTLLPNDLLCALKACSFDLEVSASNTEQLLQVDSAQWFFILQIFIWHVIW